MEFSDDLSVVNEEMKGLQSSVLSEDLLEKEREDAEWILQTLFFIIIYFMTEFNTHWDFSSTPLFSPPVFQ